MTQDFDKESFLFAANGDFVEELYTKFLENPDNVDEYWKNYFNSLSDDRTMAIVASKGASWLPKKNKIILPPEATPIDKKQKTAPVAENSAKIFNVNLLISEYRNYGHLLSNLDPLGLEKLPNLIKLDPQHYGFTEQDLDLEIELNNSSLGLEKCTIRQLMAKLKEIYSSTVGYEVSHLISDGEKDWFYNQIEQINTHYAITNEERAESLKDLIDVEGFEQFIHTRFPGTKRFSVEGSETSITAVQKIIKTAVASGVQDVVIGMAHRGRLNMLTKVMGKSYTAMLSEFQGNLAHLEELNISGDVKYHLGKSSDITSKDGHKVHLSLTPNPSHLEAVNPVVMGKVRAKQDALSDSSRSKVMGILLHGDAAFSGQGVVAESLALSNLESYTTGGIMHIVVNNQIGFTTLPKDGRLGRYCTEFAKIIQAPVIHVNGDDVEKVIMIAQMAEKYRHTFKKDIVIDIVGYRKYGHNEGDEPMFTQPVMYDAIKQKKSSVELYGEYLAKTGVMSADQITNYKSEKMKFFDQKLEEAKTYKPLESDWLQGKWTEVNKNHAKVYTTGISKEIFKEIGHALVTYPQEMSINSKVLRLIDQKKKMLETGEHIDWAMSEALAYGSLLLEGSKVRMTGQDAKRGTFSHRHAVLFDQKNEHEYVSLNHINNKQALFEVANSNLSEYAVLGYEYGYSMVDPKDLTIWEAQFGDFANGAQIMIDQFISSSETKWLRMSGLVMLLPHGYEGQGPEHSSARLERFLQMCAEDNMQVVNCSTPANFFHAIRRQIHQNSRKPLIVMSPKSLLRHKLMVSNISEFIDGTSFRPIIADKPQALAKDVKRVIICSGKVYFDLFEACEKDSVKNIALVRMDQYHPFPAEELAAELVKYENAEVVWCQEEPKNMGAWNFVESKIEDCLDRIKHKSKRAKYIGRVEAASPAAGYLKMHNVEQEKLMKKAILF